MITDLRHLRRNIDLCLDGILLYVLQSKLALYFIILSQYTNRLVISSPEQTYQNHNVELSLSTEKFSCDLALQF